jgi:hypothetical protein
MELLLVFILCVFLYMITYIVDAIGILPTLLLFLAAVIISISWTVCESFQEKPGNQRKTGPD